MRPWLIDICAHAGRAYGVRYSEGACHACSSGLGSRGRRHDRVTRRAARPSRPRSRHGLGSKLVEVAQAHPEERLQLWCEDEARIGQKGRVTQVWYAKGVRPRGPREQRYASAQLFGAVCPERDAGVALVLPEVGTAAMNLFLAELARAVPTQTHAVLVLDHAGRQVSAQLVVPANLTLIHLPSHSPELNPVEKVWQFLRDRHLSHRVLAGYSAVLDAACKAWNALRSEPGRLRSLTSSPWLPASVQTS